MDHVGIFGLSLFLAIAASTVAKDSSANRESRLAWWREARFGMFIHWGPVSLTGKEISWSRANTNPECPNQGETPAKVYDNLYQQFNPAKFDAMEWANIARKAGMKYMVLTARHGDGFLLWHSKVDAYNMAATPFGRDICAELAPAARQQGLRIGWYFSPMDWRDPDCRSIHQGRFLTRMQAELSELLSNYGRIDVLWFDSDGRPAMWDPVNTHALVRRLQPGILVNNRLEMGTQEQWMHQGKLGTNEDFYTPEQRVGAYDDRVPWETCMTIGTQWAWKPDDKIKSAQEVVSILARCVGGDGNLLLDVGPMPDGRIEERQVKVLEETGRWLEKNGESIYGTRGGPWKPSQNLASTRKGHTIFVHLLNGQETVQLPDIETRVGSATVLGGGKVKVDQRAGTLSLQLPPKSRDTLDTVVKLEISVPALSIPALNAGPDLTASASNVYGGDESEFGAMQAFDGNPGTRWATDAGTRLAWIEARLPRPKQISRVQIREAYAGRVQRFEFQYKHDKTWKPIFTGSTLGEAFEKRFQPIVASEFRLEIQDATEGPTISEIKISEE